MIEENQKYFNRLTGVVDILVCAVSYLLAWFLRFRTTLLFGTSVEAVPFAVYMEALMVIIPIMIILYSGFNLYGTNHRIKGRRLEIASIAQANGVGLLLFLSVLQLTHQDDWSRRMIFAFFVLNVILDIGARVLIWGVVKQMRKRGMNQRNVLLVGYSRAA
ncbi:MAG: undecaprenyl-phosphate glucose phosphotransferase, partial [Lachnospiraceae bacterium]|nr:undecaprenyl-phosphate glucose phosphotransferase [Lachnospiraceae bacterium]